MSSLLHAWPVVAIQAVFKVVVAAPLPVNPPEIITMGDDKFVVDTGKMEQLAPCAVKFMGSLYMLWKNEDDALVMVDVSEYAG